MSNDLLLLDGNSKSEFTYMRNLVQQSVRIAPVFQWQYSNDSVNWTDIPGATDPYYQPQAMASTTWFRRMAVECGTVLSVSNAAKVDIRSFLAPDVDPGGNIVVCPSGSATLGGSPTASGIAPPFTYSWSPSLALNDSSLANPSVTPINPSMVYTLLVTDTNQCTQKEQISVEVIVADAGPDKGICGDEEILLSTPGYPGFTHLNFLWTAIGGSGSASILSPNTPSTQVIPNQSTVYVISVDDGGVSGGTCPTDTISLSLTSPPLANAGADIGICELQHVTLGTPGQPGNYYFWSPGSHLSGTFIDRPTYDGSFPSDAVGYYRTYYLTAIRTDAFCKADYDTVNVYVGFARAGLDGCGPRYIGHSDYTGGLATYQWTVVYGDLSSIVGKASQPRPFVNPAIPTLYELSVTINGVTCTDQVFVPYCGCPQPGGVIEVPLDCYHYLQVLPFQLHPANMDPLNYDYEWTGGDTSLLDNPRIPYPKLIA
ncbi:MAG: hypothetical protein IH599_05665, partial [Bacteroidales bacterium]|nr:hypothetical protein [Bacteroidales bacterium]